MSEYKRIIIIHWSMTYVLFSIPISSKYIPFYNVPEIFNRNMHQVIFGQEFRASSVSHLISSYEEIRCYLSDVNVIWFRFSRFVLSYLSTTVWNHLSKELGDATNPKFELSICQIKCHLILSLAPCLCLCLMFSLVKAMSPTHNCCHPILQLIHNL